MHDRTQLLQRACRVTQAWDAVRTIRSRHATGIASLCYSDRRYMADTSPDAGFQCCGSRKLRYRESLTARSPEITGMGLGVCEHARTSFVSRLATWPCVFSTRLRSQIQLAPSGTGAHGPCDGVTAMAALPNRLRYCPRGRGSEISIRCSPRGDTTQRVSSLLVSLYALSHVLDVSGFSPVRPH